MLNLDATRIAFPVEVGGLEVVVAFFVKAPPAEFRRQVSAALTKKTPEARLKALDEVFAADRVAPLVVGWEGFGARDEALREIPAPFSAAALTRALTDHPVVLAKLALKLRETIAQEVRGNSVPSPAGSTGEGETTAASADPGPSAGE